MSGPYECPYGKPGDRLWVREAWRVPKVLNDLSGNEIGERCVAAGYRLPWCPTRFEADGSLTSEKDWREFGNHPGEATPGRYRHARFMPRWASRIVLHVVCVRVQRLQDISEDDARAEGCCAIPGFTWRTFEEADRGIPMHAHTAKDAFEALWKSINGAGSWDANPWVWVVEFKRIEGKTCI
jgi:hypothetical protein